MALPVVSVIVTAHNYGRFLDQCIRSVLGQTFQDFELIIANDGSIDNTAEVLETYVNDARVRVLPLPGVGLAAACNAGIRASRGRWVIRLDADDFLDPHALLVMTEVLTRRPEIGLAYPDYYLVDEQSRFLGFVRVPRIQEGERLLGNNPLAAGCLYRRSCFDALGGYNETLRYQEDYDFWLRFTERFRAWAVGLPLLFYRQHGNSMSKSRANRAAARRYVKREFTRMHRQPGGQAAVCVIPGIWPGVPDRSPALLCREIGGHTPIALAVEQAKACESIDRVVVVTDHPELGRMARAVGAELMAPPAAAPQTSDSAAALAWVQGLMKGGAADNLGPPSLVLLASPFCPFRHPDRLQEALDTVLIHSCDVVVSVDAEPVVPWSVSPEGLELLTAGRALREAGEVLAVRTDWLMEGHPVTDALVGSIELLYPEWWCLKDEASMRTCETLLAESAALRVSRSAYLRTVG